ncbi:MAG: hypothetical protein LC687_04945, partial [Actinobacteria bacterium]|nr:hypothetical protein [Actinomycetota bacterium]MCA1807181.1 hypothetical protein [Actinomycetota bacterium]
MTYTFKALVSSAYHELPDWVGSKQLGYDFSDVGSLTGNYAKHGKNADLLTSPSGCVIIAYWNGVEQFNSRFYVQGGESKDSDPTEPFEKILAPSILDVFRRVVVDHPSGLSLTFAGQTPGAILHSLFTDAQARGAMTGITWNFNGSTTSSGSAWTYFVPEIEYKLGLKYIDVIRNFVDQGLIELRFNGSQLQVFNADAMGVDRAIGDTPLELRAGLDYSETPRKWSVADRAKFSMAMGDEGAIVRREDGNVPNGPFGREEMAVTQGGTSDT